MGYVNTFDFFVVSICIVCCLVVLLRYHVLLGRRMCRFCSEYCRDTDRECKRNVNTF